MPNGGPAAGLLQATRRPPVGRPPATAAATRRAERQATRRPPRKRQATRRPPGASHRQGVALIGVHFSQCQRRAGHPQGVALLYTARQFASGVVGWAYIVGPPLAGGLPRVACPGWSAGGWPAAQPRHLLPLNPGTLLPLGPAFRIHSCLFFLLFRARAGFELEADGGAFEAEGFAQAVLQVTLVGKVNGFGVVDEEDEGGRVHGSLSCVVNL